PQYRAVISTYLRNLDDMQLEEIPFDVTGGTDIEQLSRRLNDESMCTVVGYPNFFGVIEELGPIQSAFARSGAQLITGTPGPLALGVLKAPGAWGGGFRGGEGQA